MKKFLLGAIAALTALSAMADLNGDGYYRLQNALTKRYVYLLDNKGKVDVQTSSADVGALQLYKNLSRAISDPSTIFLLTNAGGYDHNVAGQGTDLYSFLGSYLKIRKAKNYDGQQAYYAYATKSSLSRFLGDIRSDFDMDEGYPSADGSGDNRLWYIHPMNTSGENYFGITPSLTAGGKYYHTLYAGFPVSASSSGVKFYVVSRVEPEYGVVVISEVSGKIPSGTPVIVECASPVADSNRLNVNPDGQTANVSSNLLKGTYFDNSEATHYNRTPYDKNTMRSLAVVDGKLMFVKGNYDFMPRNEAVLQLPTPECADIERLKVMTEAEFSDYVASIGEVVPDGYYRLQNASTRRYAYIADNRGNDLDASSIQLFSNLLKASSDPASVMYAYRPAAGGSLQRNISSQSVDTKDFLGGPLSISIASDTPGNVTYYVSTVSGKLGDSAASGDKGQMTVGMSGNAAAWKFNAISNDGDNHFGVAPTLTAGGKYYQPFMAAFPVAAYSDGVRFYTVSKIDSELGVMVMNEVSGVIPAGTPVIVECAGPLAAGNRLTVGATGSAADVAGNLLGAVYLDNTDTGHSNATSYNASSMRSLAVIDGKLTFAPANITTVPRNQAFITLTTDDQKKIAQYSVMTKDEYDDYLDELAGLGEGYYRMQNTTTGRYVYMIDNKASISNPETSDFRAFQLYADKSQSVSDPASVFSFTKVPSAAAIPDWNLTSQNASFTDMLSYPVKMMPVDEQNGSKIFDAYIIKDEVTFHLGDANGGTAGDSHLTTSESAAGKLWKLNAVDAADDANFFGVAPSVSADGKYYQPFFAEFPFEPYSEGMKVYYVNKIDADYQVMVLSEITGIVPARTPVIIECTGASASDNRLDLAHGRVVGDYRDNLLKGVWYESRVSGHLNRTPFDKTSMRVLGVLDGKPAFVKGTVNFVPRNQAYIQLADDNHLAVDGYKLLTREEYIALAGVNEIAADSVVDVFSLNGTEVCTGISRPEVNNLPQGFYILRSGNATEKVFVK